MLFSLQQKAYEPVIFHCTQALKVDQENAKVRPFFAQRALLLAVVDVPTLSNPPKIPKMVVSSGNSGQNDQYFFRNFALVTVTFLFPPNKKR